MIRHVPLRRGDSRLRRISAFLARREPLPRVGQRGRETEAVMRRLRPVVKRRARYRCEVCGERLPLDVHHAYGRIGTGACLGEWAHSPELCVALCRLDHDRAHCGLLAPSERWALDATALRRFARARLDRSVEIDPAWSHSDFCGAVRQLVSELEQRGEQP